MCDDGAGAAALSALEAGWELPAGIDRLDLGTPGPYLAEYLRGYEAIVLFDAIAADAAPGEIVAYRVDADHAAPAGPRLTPHAVDLHGALATLAFEGLEPASVAVVGIVPERVEAGTTLSGRVQLALAHAASLAVIELESLGFRVPRSASQVEPAPR